MFLYPTTLPVEAISTNLSTKIEVEIDKKNKLKQITCYLFTQEHQLTDFKLKLAFWNNNTHTGLKADAGMLHFKLI